jgi:poly(3-hydroxybutyrate) depolymerase
MRPTFQAILLSGLTALPLSQAAKPSAGCSKPAALEAGNHTMTVNGTSRWFLIKLPEPYNPANPHRLVFTLHAKGGNAGQVAQGTGGYLPWYGLPPLINDTASAIYVSPNGLNAGWENVGGDDITLVDNIAKTAKASLCVDENLVFATGFSYGASMSYAIGCALSKTFRAVAPLSGRNRSGCAGGRDPVPYYGQHGIGDEQIPIEEGRAIRDTFVRNNGCDAVATGPGTTPAKGSGSHVKTVYKGCKDGFPVTWVEFDGPHTPQPKDRGASKTFAADETWAFFSQFK